MAATLIVNYVTNELAVTTVKEEDRIKIIGCSCGRTCQKFEDRSEASRLCEPRGTAAQFDTQPGEHR